MLSLDTALKLKYAGLKWLPKINDFFAIPDRGMDDRIFVVSDMLVTLESIFNTQVVSFQGAPEWALDSLVITEVVWIPSESQLRQALEDALDGTNQYKLSFIISKGNYRCIFTNQGVQLDIEDHDASETYAKALLAVWNMKN